jgi:hypothetical protein
MSEGYGRMKCRICASECPPGAKLCRDCAAARKRAFAATVTQPLFAAAGASSIGHPRFAPRPKQRITRKPYAATAARSEAVIAAAALDASVAPRRLGVRWLWLALAIAIAIVYLLIRMLAGNHGESSDAPSPSDSASEVAAPAAPAPAVDPLSAAAASARAAASHPDAGAPAEGATNKNAAPKTRLRKPAPKLELPNSAEPAPAPTVELAPAPRTPLPQVAEPPRDPWQVMNEGLSRCAREDWVGRATCEQRLRLQYCPEHWGLVAQCPIGPTDHGS